MDYGPRGPPPPHPNEQPSSTVPHHPNQFQDQYRQFGPQYRGYSPHYPPGYMPPSGFKGMYLFCSSFIPQSIWLLFSVSSISKLNFRLTIFTTRNLNFDNDHSRNVDHLTLDI